MKRDDDAQLQAFRQLAPEILRFLRSGSSSELEAEANDDERELLERAQNTAARFQKVQREVTRELEMHPAQGTRVSRKSDRPLGPYAERAGWRVIEVDANGDRTSSFFDTEKKALRYVEILVAELKREDHTTETALADDKGNKRDSGRQTCSLIGAFFPDPISLKLLTDKRCDALYADMRSQKKAKATSRASQPIHTAAHCHK